MYFDRHAYLRAQGRHERLLVEARILRLIRAAQGGPARQPATRRQSLLLRVIALLRERPPVRA
ncbi:MAG: hypothetical protein DIU80_016160 [Chloroflexota bacterium]